MKRPTNTHQPAHQLLLLLPAQSVLNYSYVHTYPTLQISSESQHMCWHSAAL